MVGGTYSYIEAFPSPAIGGTPVLLGLEHYAYYFFISYFIANLLVDGVIVSSNEIWWKWAPFVSFISSAIVMGIDMMADPVQVNVFQQLVHRISVSRTAITSGTSSSTPLSSSYLITWRYGSTPGRLVNHFP